MTLVPVAPPGGPGTHTPPPPLGGAFSCTLCGKCCTDLREREEAAWPVGFDRLARRGYYRLPTREGLQAWGWERQRMTEAAAASGRTIAFVPSVVVVDDAHARIVTLTWELDHDTCPFLVPGTDAPDTFVCDAYDARPTICRAFPVLTRDGALTYSSRCPVSFLPGDAQPDARPGDARAAYQHAYGESFHAAEAALGVPAHVAQTLQFLETVGEVRLARNLSRESLLSRLLRWPVADFYADVLTNSRAMQPDAFMDRLPAHLR